MPAIAWPAALARLEDPVLELVDLPIPERVGAPGWEDFAATVRVDNACQVAGYGTPDVIVTAEERLPHWHDPEEDGLLIAARLDGEIVGRLADRWTLEAPDTGFVDLQVLPAAQGRGVGSALHDRLEQIARERGQRKLIAYAVSPDAAGERLASPTGFGSVPAANREVRFLRDRGWRLEQVERGSRLALPPDRRALAALRRAAEEHAEGYRVRTWIGVTPEPLRGGMAELLERMTTDAPTAGLEEPPETWDATRVLEHETRLDAAPTDILTTAVEHVATGRLAGFTRVSVPYEARVVSQWDTIVRAEDRGHRLGMLVKVANLEALDERLPGHPSVVTWNAEENRHMLSVNEVIGFVPIGYEGAWRARRPLEWAIAGKPEDRASVFKGAVSGPCAGAGS
jgi:GNAT superfamily N-acetyltransferase